MKILFIVGLTIISVIAEETRLDDLPPNEAQQILDKQDLSLKYAPKVDTNVPALRFLGNQQHEVLEDIYLARQFHGQDGVGGYVYGYSVPDIAKAEKKKAGGDLRGAYSYVNGDGQEIKVEYWDDGTGFHQVDNLPKIALHANDDTPEVKAAREEHFRIWNEIAEQHKKYNPNNGNAYAASNYNEQQDQYDDGRYDQPAENRQYEEQRRPDQVQPHPAGNQQYEEQHPAKNRQHQDQQYPAENRQYQDQQHPAENRQYQDQEEPVSDPKGFFYSYDYPVGIIVQKGRAVGGIHEQPQHKRETILFDQLYNKNRAILNGPAPVVRRRRSADYYKTARRIIYPILV